eukprot:115474-Prymnesium_polylepis.1
MHFRNRQVANKKLLIVTRSPHSNARHASPLPLSMLYTTRPLSHAAIPYPTINSRTIDSIEESMPVVEKWMEPQSGLVDPHLGFFNILHRMSMKASLSLCASHGLNLPEFMDTSSMNMVNVLRLTYAQDWKALDKLVVPSVQHQMRSFMDDILYDGPVRTRRRVSNEVVPQVSSALLRAVEVVDLDHLYTSNEAQRRALGLRAVEDIRIADKAGGALLKLQVRFVYDISILVVHDDGSPVGPGIYASGNRGTDGYIHNEGVEDTVWFEGLVVPQTKDRVRGKPQRSSKRLTTRPTASGDVNWRVLAWH